MAGKFDRDDMRLIEAGFPGHQVGAETQRERGTSSALPPLYYLHVWWARRPLTPSRAAILASLLPADTDPEWFLRQLGIEKVQALVNGVPWTLVGALREQITVHEDGRELLRVDKKLLRALEKEQERRSANREIIAHLGQADPRLSKHPVVVRWSDDSMALEEPWPSPGQYLKVRRIAGDPAGINDAIEFSESATVQSIMGRAIRWDPEDLYGYSRAYARRPSPPNNLAIMLDPVAGGGSIPFEALRLGHRVIVNDLNPVAAVILHATLDYPARFGVNLAEALEEWGKALVSCVERKMADVTPFSPLPPEELADLKNHCRNLEVVERFAGPETDHVGLLYVRQVTCPHCGGEAPLLNTSWLSKEGQKWGVRVVTDGRSRGGKVRFETYRIKGNRGPNGEDPDFATVNTGEGTCVHCRQQIAAEEIKAQARGESDHGAWQDRLYCVVAVRYQPQVDRQGEPVRYASGVRQGEIKTEKVRFFRPPYRQDLEALTEAERRLRARWPEWERQGLIPTETIPQDGHKTQEPVRVGIKRWCDMFTPRQLLGHLTLVEELNRLKPQILHQLGPERGRAVITYLQFMIDKGVDYNSRQTRWEYTRSVVKGTFGRHDFSLKWTFGEMVFSGPHSGAAWALSQVVDAYQGLAQLLEPLHRRPGGPPAVDIRCGTAAHIDLPGQSVDLICMDPPYYNNVQYAELSDFFYVWQKRTLHDLYPELFRRRLTNKQDEAVANPVRDGSAPGASATYEQLMREIFAECHRLLKDDGIMTVMFNHKTQEAWATLTRALIESDWTITSSMPVESESAVSMHQKDQAAAASSIFLSCRKRKAAPPGEFATWTSLGGAGVAEKVRVAVRQGLQDFAKLRLNPVDEMVASYGRALRVLAEHWPVLDGNELVSPLRAMNEASAVVAQSQIGRLTQGHLRMEDLHPETAMALTFYGIFRLAHFPYDEALNISRSLNIKLEGAAGGYALNGRLIGINSETRRGRAARPATVDRAHPAPLLRQGAQLRLALPEERHERRLENPQTEWDMLHGLIMAYRAGDIPVARDYLQRQARGREAVILDLLSVWTVEMPEQTLRQEGEAMLFGLKLE